MELCESTSNFDLLFLGVSKTSPLRLEKNKKSTFSFSSPSLSSPRLLSSSLSSGNHFLSFFFFTRVRVGISVEGEHTKTKLLERQKERKRGSLVAGGEQTTTGPLSLSLSLHPPLSHTGDISSVVVLELAPVGPAGLPEGADLLLGHVLSRLLESLPVEGAELVEALFVDFFFFFWWWWSRL